MERYPGALDASAVRDGRPRRVRALGLSITENTMRFTHWSWIGACALFCTSGCDAPDESPAETVTKAAAALSSGKPSSIAGRRVHRSHADQSAKAHPTGRRELDANDRIRAADGAQKVIGVQPTQLLLDRLQEESTARGDKSSRAHTSRLTELNAAVVPFGDDLIIADPASEQRSTSSVLPELPRAVDNSALPAFPEIRDQQ